MRSVIFDGRFGWLHEPAGSSPRLGVVMCRPMGNEDVCTHREWMELADTLAAHGLTALRFDWRSSGDSADQDGPPGLRTWIDDVRAAAAFLAAQDGVRGIALCGLRLGGAVALLAARELAGETSGVAALALLAPVVSGRSYVRELRAAASGSALAVLDPPPPPGSPLPLNLNGFLWDRQTLREIETIDLAAPGVAPAPQALLLTRGPGKQGARFAAALREGGVALREADFPGYEAFINAPITPAPPREAFATVAGWLAGLSDIPPAPRLPAPPPSATLDLPGAREVPLRFGRGDALFGMLCEPPAGAGGTAVLMVHTGTSHHIGNGRMLVQMARHLASRGVASLRMDVAGIGDSPQWPDDPHSPLYGRHGPDDVAAALDALEARGIRRVLMVGICAGAYLALQMALADRRIAGMAAVNLQCFTWVEGTSLEVAIREAKRTLRSYMRSMSNPGEWRRLARGDGDVIGIARTLAMRGVQQAGHRLRDLLPPPEGSLTQRVRGWMAALDARGIPAWFVYGADDPGLGQFHAHLGRGGRHLRATPSVKLKLMPHADHNVSAVSARERFIALFDGLVDEVVAAEAAATPGPRSEGRTERAESLPA